MAYQLTVLYYLYRLLDDKKPDSACLCRVKQNFNIYQCLYHDKHIMYSRSYYSLKGKNSALLNERTWCKKDFYPQSNLFSILPHDRNLSIHLCG